MLVDGPLTGVPRQEYRLNNLHLTKYRIKFPFTAPTRIVRKAWVDSDLKAQWKVSPWSVKAQNICKVCTKYFTTRESVSCVAHDDNWKFLIGIAGWYIYEASFIFNWNQRTNFIWRFFCKHQLNTSIILSLQRSQLTDFDRFKLRFAKRQRNKLLTIAFNTLKKRTKSDGTPRILKKDRRERLRAEKAKGGKKAAAKK